MILTADYHTHTTYSHGKGSVEENALAAAARGLKKRKVPHFVKDVAAAGGKTGVRVLAGVEANILSEDGKTDFKEKYFDDLDVFLAGFHKFVLCGPGAACKLLFPNYLRSGLRLAPSSPLVSRTTKAYIRLIENNPVDAVSHLNFCVFSNAAVAIERHPGIKTEEREVHPEKQPDRTC